MDLNFRLSEELEIEDIERFLTFLYLFSLLFLFRNYNRLKITYNEMINRRKQNKVERKMKGVLPKHKSNQPERN